MAESAGGSAPGSPNSDASHQSGGEGSPLAEKLAQRTAELSQATTLLNDMDRRFTKQSEELAAERERSSQLAATTETLRRCSRQPCLLRHSALCTLHTDTLHRKTTE